MPIEVYPAPAAASSINASSITATAANILYESAISLDPAIYTITCISTTIARVEFYSDNVTLITNTITDSGTVTINLATAATKVRIWINTGSNVVITITKIASALTDAGFSGTLDTITSTGTYTGTSTSGYGYAVLVGGGGGSGGTPHGQGAAGGGGGGGVAEKLVQLTGSMAVTIGAFGTVGGVQATGGAGGNSTFASMTANGGAGGGSSNQGSGPGGAGGTATGGTYNTTGTSGANGFNGSGGNGGSPQNIYKFAVATIGTGATSLGYNFGGATGTGKGAGASGTSHSIPNTNGVGTAGVLYVLRF